MTDADIVREWVAHASEIHSGATDALAALDRLEARVTELEAERDEWKRDRDYVWEKGVELKPRAETAEAEVKRLNHENAALEAEARTLRETLVEAREFVDRRHDGTDRSRLLLSLIEAALAKEEGWGSLDTLTGSTAPTKEDTDE